MALRCVRAELGDEGQGVIPYVRIFGRAFAIVVFTAMNVRFISSGKVLAMFLTGCAISGVWWFNARLAARSDLRGAGITYALGAGCATVTGWWLAGWL
jgi:hypothetical protein